MGNTVVLKPAEQTPLTALRLAELASEVGFPAGVFNVVCGFGPTAGAAISNHMRIRKVAFTGSTVIGREILKASANSNLKQVQLELGGKSPIVIFPDANLDAAVEIAANGVFANNGQSCDAASRCFVHESIYDAFVEKAVAFAKNLKVGNQLDMSTVIGPLVDRQQYEKVLEYIEIGKKEGATVAYNGNVTKNEKGFLVHPVVFSDVTDDMTIAKEEIFGPVQQILKFKTTEEVIERANATEYGLAAGVVSENVNNVWSIANNVQAGTIWCNTYSYIFPQVEFGGHKQSGFGREGGATALSEWTQLKSVILKLNKPTH
jgi:acyl-CoA reductase-like NAD-dependent aldehyde dehydrogenase